MRNIKRQMTPIFISGGIISLCLFTGCSENSMLNSMGKSEDGASYADTGYWGGPSAENDADADADTDGDDWGDPETEDDFLALSPAQTDVYVFIANPERDTVTRINVETLAVSTTSVGRDPSIVITTPDYQSAVVFNRGDDSVTIIDADTLVSMDVEVRDNFNNMVMSPNGEWVALWHDIGAEQPDDPSPSGLQSFNEASFVNVYTGEHSPMAVGFNPRAIHFTSDSSLGVVVSDSYLSLVDLFAESLMPELVSLALDDDPVELLEDPPAAEEVVISGDGSFAFVRQFGTDRLLVVDLLEGDVDALEVGLNPTDLDISPDGSMVVVVARSDHKLVVFDAEDPFSNGGEPVEEIDLYEDLDLGSLVFDPTGNKAIVYTTASLLDRYVAWDVLEGSTSRRGLEKPISSVAITPGGESMLVFHTQGNAAGADSTSPFYNEWAISMIRLSDYNTNPLILPAEPSGYANSSNGNYGFFIMEGERYLEVLDYQTLLYDQYEISSDPVYIGVLPDLDLDDNDEPLAWVSQEHDLGRLTFFDPDDASLETLTGFELNSQIED